MWKRNFVLILALHIGFILFPFITISDEKITAYRVAFALMTSAAIYSLEIILMYLIFNWYGVKFKEGIFRLLELKQEEYRRLSKKERDMLYKLGYVILGAPTLAMIISGGILEWGNPTTAFKFLMVFFAFLIPLLQVCILPLVILFATYNRFIAKNLNTCIESSAFWVRLSLPGLFLVVLSILSADEKESLPFLSTIVDHWDVFLLASLLNAFVGVLQYVMVVANSRALLTTLLLVLYSSPVAGMALLLDLFGVTSLQEIVKMSAIAALTIFLAMFAVTYLILRIFGYSIVSIEKAVEVASVRTEKPLKNVLFWILWANAAVLALGIALTVHILKGL